MLIREFMIMVSVFLPKKLYIVRIDAVTSENITDVNFINRAISLKIK